MKLPNKIYSYSESTISKFIPIIEQLENKDETVTSLYQKTKKNFNDIEDYIDTLDCLFALNKIELSEKEELHYVVWNILWTIPPEKNYI